MTFSQIENSTASTALAFFPFRDKLEEQLLDSFLWHLKTISISVKDLRKRSTWETKKLSPKL